MNKKIIALQGRANVGKTTTLNLVYDLIKLEFPNHKVLEETNRKYKDFMTIIEIKEKLIGIETRGDCATNHNRDALPLSLKKFNELDCTLIICAVRTSGSTVACIKSYQQYGLDIIKKEIDKLDSFTVNKKDADLILNKVIKHIKSF